MSNLPVLQSYYEKEIKNKTKQLLLKRGTRVIVIDDKKKMKNLINLSIGLGNYEEKYEFLGKTGVVVDVDKDLNESKISFSKKSVWFPIKALYLEKEVSLEDVKYLKSRYDKNPKYQCLKNRLSFYDVVKMQQNKQQKSVSVQRKIIDKLVRKSRMNLKELSEYHKKCHDNYSKRQINFDKNIKSIKRNRIIDRLI